jgi:diadenosine tetraphosphate (Ap4A) HIT family hydrolase
MGSLVLICKEDAEAFADVSPEAFVEQRQAVSDIEATLKASPFDAVKMNYLMLMMKDPQVHYHVLPRPLEEKVFDGVTFSDPPGPPNMTATAELGEETLSKVKQLLVDNWPKGTITAAL